MRATAAFCPLGSQPMGVEQAHGAGVVTYQQAVRGTSFFNHLVFRNMAAVCIICINYLLLHSLSISQLLRCVRGFNAERQVVYPSGEVSINAFIYAFLFQVWGTLFLFQFRPAEEALIKKAAKSCRALSALT